MACSLYFISVYLVSKNPEILSNPMPQNQINGVDETANVTVGFDRHNALIWSFKAKISAFQGELQSYNLFLLNIDFYWLRRNFLSFFLQKLPWFWFIFHMEQNLTQKVQNLRCLIRLGRGGINPNGLDWKGNSASVNQQLHMGLTYYEQKLREALKKTAYFETLY